MFPPPLSRRRFLAQTAGLTAAALLPNRALGQLKALGLAMHDTGEDQARRNAGQLVCFAEDDDRGDRR